MGDPVEKQPEINFDDLDPAEDYKIVVEGRDPEAEEKPPAEADEYKDLTREQIIAKIEAERQEKSKLMSQTDAVAAIRDGIGQLVDRGREAPKAPPSPVPQPLDENALSAELKEKIYEDPKAAIDTYVQKKLGPEIGRLFQTNTYWSRRDIEKDPETSETFKKYRTEIEEEVQRSNLTERISDPEIYKKAHDRVVSRHFNEIVDMKVKEAVEKMTVQQKTSSQPGEPPFAETQVRRPGGVQGTPKTVRLTRDDMTQLEGLQRKGLAMSERQFYEWKYGGAK